MLTDDSMKPDDTRTHPAEEYQAKNIELMLGTTVSKIDRAAHEVTLENGEVLAYGKLLLALGAEAKAPDLPGADYPNVYMVRKMEDSLKLRGALKCAEKVVVLGGSYLGMEVASGCIKHRIDVTVIDHHEGPWAKFASPALQKFLVDQYSVKGAKFIFNEKPEKINGNSDAAYAESVQTSQGAILCDLVIAATGAKLNLDLARATGLKVDEKNGVVVNEYLQSVTDEDVYIAGDTACFPDAFTGKTWHVEHYMNGLWQGECAGANMAGEQHAFKKIAYFFSDFLDLHMTLRGNPQGGKNTKVLGDMEGGEFIELYSDDSGVITMGVAISHDGKKVEDAADRLELLLAKKSRAEDLGEGAFGEYFGAS
jgi:3-phenylpropionate/trans-cinnamate dioxygenase ferredoxin reductase subunit